jgi:hypothetical protein
MTVMSSREGVKKWRTSRKVSVAQRPVAECECGKMTVTPH